jgi:hypothetical protein
MSKEIKDYLHLYLGCEVETYWDWDNKLSPHLLMKISEDGFKKVKPILRPLSSMTEEEAIELAKLSEHEPDFNDVKIERTKFNDIVVTWQGANESRESFNATGDLFYCAEQFQWLLSKHFDLFELIHYGLAIEKECDHDWQGDGRDSHKQYLKCAKCGKTDWE